MEQYMISPDLKKYSPLSMQKYIETTNLVPLGLQKVVEEHLINATEVFPDIADSSFIVRSNWAPMPFEPGQIRRYGTQRISIFLTWAQASAFPNSAPEMYWLARFPTKGARLDRIFIREDYYNQSKWLKSELMAARLRQV